ncbi:hypothetical protein OROHE_019040 [Orobanche hederae]
MNSHVDIHGPIFTVGQGRKCDLRIEDPTGSEILCNLKDTDSKSVLEVIGDKGFVRVNEKVTPKGQLLVYAGAMKC